jgi:CDP-paratose 2-epimerase
VLDNLSRRGAESNLKWLNEQARFEFHQVDVRDKQSIERVIKETRPDAVLHLAGQVAVTTSVQNPAEDFDINALGTFNLLEAVRSFSKESFFINASTNKVYGRMEEVGVIERNGRYEYENLIEGIDENRVLDFHSPYGCSKGAADQYTIDYSRIYGIRSTSFRQSCIYGPRQFGIEDQGWVAWFVIASCLGMPITIYGDGKQTRDILHVNDLISAYDAAIDNQEAASGQSFNIGGGAENIISLLELVDFLRHTAGKNIAVTFEQWRPGDQRVFVSNVAKAKRVLRWSPTITSNQGISQLVEWVDTNKELFCL